VDELVGHIPINIGTAEFNPDDAWFNHHHWHITATCGKLQGFLPIFGPQFWNFKVGK
jgi:hypothetical protein